MCRQTERDEILCALVEPPHSATPEDTTPNTQQTAYSAPLRLIVVQSSTEAHWALEGDWIWPIPKILLSSIPTPPSVFG
jgi:hypothetical protein